MFEGESKLPDYVQNTMNKIWYVHVQQQMTTTELKAPDLHEFVF